MRFIGTFFCVVSLLQGCCRTDKCLNARTGPDGLRTRAKPLRLGVVVNDTVSSPQRDRTDWKFVLLPRAGRLEVTLHWDNGRANLGLGVFNTMGVKIQSGRVWGTGGLRALVAIEEPGRYYVRIRAQQTDDESPYSIRAVFRAEKLGKGAEICHKCKEGERKCLGHDSYTVCAKMKWGCNAWADVFRCPTGSCKEGLCVGACADECAEGETRCSGGGVQKCVKTEAGCRVWGSVQKCGGGRRCTRGRCARGRVTRPPRPTPPTPKPQPMVTSVKGKIISLYVYRGRPTLHIELVTPNAVVKPGMQGSVQKGNSGRPLPNGQIQVVKVTGHYCIATTQLQKLGQNRWVVIYARQ
jgi:hypothetical protein